jgi:hypothetical protein
MLTRKGCFPATRFRESNLHCRQALSFCGQSQVHTRRVAARSRYLNANGHSHAAKRPWSRASLSPVSESQNS